MVITKGEGGSGKKQWRGESARAVRKGELTGGH